MNGVIHYRKDYGLPMSTLNHWMGWWSITSVHLVTVNVVVVKIKELVHATVYTMIAIRIFSVCVEEKVSSICVNLTELSKICTWYDCLSPYQNTLWFVHTCYINIIVKTILMKVSWFRSLKFSYSGKFCDYQVHLYWWDVLAKPTRGNTLMSITIT